jgi:hypothetical protein
MGGIVRTLYSLAPTSSSHDTGTCSDFSDSKSLLKYKIPNQQLEIHSVEEPIHCEYDRNELVQRVLLAAPKHLL